MAENATERYAVRSYEVDGHGRLAVPALCNYLQESAGLHARQLGVSVEQLAQVFADEFDAVADLYPAGLFEYLQ